ncbi:MAG: HDIG domain-containing protein [Bacteroidaceae bacterium]|nr:HDIG domain-containing protein [Bacteroidaceae bacterium]
MDVKSFPYTIINKYYPEDNQLRYILLTHSEQVAKKSLQVANAHPELQLDSKFLEEASLLHDIGIFLCDAPAIQCFGSYQYICHGYLGAELMRREGYERHALVCERHTGAGLSLLQIQDKNLPVPHRDMLPVSIEEQVVCFADKFYSKTKLAEEKTVEQARKSLFKFGEEGVVRFDGWCKMFL